MDAPGIRRDQQQLGYLVGRGFHRRSDADTVANSDSNSDAHANSDSNAHANSDSNAHANSDSDSDADAYAYAKPDAVTHSNGDTHPNADGDADPYSDTFADPNAITVADCDTHADADGRRHDAPGWQSRHLLSRLVGAERRDAALSRLCQRGRTATRTRAQYLQRRYQRDARRRGYFEVHDPRH
jgi:hypothetical protein